MCTKERKKRYEYQKIDINCLFCGHRCCRKFIFISGSGVEMFTDSASGECHVCYFITARWYGLAAAFLAALIRNILGLGTLLAFPGSMCGALLSGLLYKWMKKLPAAYIGEVVGTGIIGGMLSYPIAAVLMGNQTAALFTFVVPFLISTVGGTIMAIVITMTMKKTKVLAKFQQQINS